MRTVAPMKDPRAHAMIEAAMVVRRSGYETSAPPSNLNL
jgi:hypothetical protein